MIAISATDGRTGNLPDRGNGTMKKSFSRSCHGHNATLLFAEMINNRSRSRSIAVLTGVRARVTLKNAEQEFVLFNGLFLVFSCDVFC